MSRAEIRDAGILEVFDRVIAKSIAGEALDVGETNFVREHAHHMTAEERARFAFLSDEPASDPDTKGEETNDSAMTVKDIKDKLTNLGVPFESRAAKKTLEALLKAQEHIVTAEDIATNPDLTAEGINEGDLIYLPYSEGDEA